MPLDLSHDWYPVVVPPNVITGDRNWLYSSFAFLHFNSKREPAVKIGHDTGVYNGCFFELGPQGEVEIGDYCSLVGVIIRTNGRVAIRDYAFIAHEVVIADHEYAVPGREESPSQVMIEEGAWIGAGAVIVGSVRIGRGAIVGAGAVVRCDVPDGATAAGNPLNIYRKQ